MLEHVVLIGPMGSGKSSIGRKLAKELGVSFVDTDALIQKKYGPIADLFQNHGEPYFRGIEAETVAQVLAEDPAIVALGGGAVVTPATQELLRDYLVVELSVREAQIAARISGSGRPLLNDSDDPIARWRELYESRRRLYQGLSSVTFDTGAGSFEEIVTHIANWLRASDRLGLDSLDTGGDDDA